MSEFRLPSLGADMKDATLREWFVEPGDTVTKGDSIAAVETDKGIIDIEVFESGTVKEILVQPDEKVPVGTVLATIRSGGKTQGHAEPRKAGVSEDKQAPPEDMPRALNIQPPPGGERKRISPAARKRARELSVDPENIVGTGPGGAVTLEDVASSAGPAAPTGTVAGTAEKQAEAAASSMRRAIAAAVVRSNREIPHYYLSTSIDLTPALTWLEQQNAERPLPLRLVYAILLLKAVAGALQKVPEMNGFFMDDAAQVKDDVHVGVAISLRSGGLLVPTLRDVHRKNPDELMAEFSDLVNRARSGHLRGSELQDATITVTSLGEQGVDTVFPIIYPPQLAIVGFGSIVERVRPVNRAPQVRRVINASLAADHRASDGHRGALFLAEIDRLLQEPERL
ncbi:dihydrolipoamide acetyltransferase family protein [Microbulbifer hainanensis]|uniref:dihydrolipoamide acetyltransferase family protein n=1 Tax=Microbulbifer hainanensis TaxID=2735675 RepID=UPI0018684DC4|nr:dihydrolipoamide acetyltransferase family protein [Microbulbifer hainanensis]